jgi:hypothetical protein
MVNYAGFFEILKTQNFHGPVQVHYEYPGFGGANDGRSKLEIPKEQLVSQMRHDLNYVRKLMTQAKLI